MRRVVVSIARALTLVTIAGAPALAQDSAGVIEGIVRDTAITPIHGAVVRIGRLYKVTRTDSLGRYRLEGIQPGRLLVNSFGLGYRSVSESVTVASGAVTHVDLVLHEIAKRRTVRLPCPPGTRAPGGGVCLPSREVGTLDDAPTGVGIIRDRATWDAVKRRFHIRVMTTPPDSAIDWTREMLVLLSYGGGLVEMDEDVGFSRVETRDSVLVVTLGPDSIIGRREIFEDEITFPVVIAIPRSSRPVRYERPVDEGWTPRVVDWRAVVDTTPHSPRYP